MAKADAPTVLETSASAPSEGDSAISEAEQNLAPTEVFATPSIRQGYDQNSGAFNF